MLIKNILLKEGFKYFLSRRWNFIFLFLAFVVLFSLFGPVFKTHETNRRAVERLVNQSGAFDYKLKLPDQRFLINQPTTPNLTPINQMVSKIKADPTWQTQPFNFFWASSTSWTNYFAKDPASKRYFMLKVGIEDVLPAPSYRQDLSNLVLKAGRLPKSNEQAIVLNAKFAQLNNYQLNDEITLFNDKKFKIVGIGNSVNHMFMEFATLLRIKRQLQIPDAEFKTANLYRLSGIVYFTRSLFNQLVSDKTLLNFRNDLYLKFSGSETAKALALKRFVSDLETRLKVRIESITNFANDSSAGLRNAYAGIETLIFSLVFAVGCFFIITFISLIVSKMVRKTTMTISRLISFGYGPWQITLNFFFFPFLVLLVAAIFAFTFGTLLDNYLSSILNKNGFLVFDFIPFNFFWFATFVVLLPTFLGGTFLFFGYLRIRNSFRFLFDQHFENELLLRRTFVFRRIGMLVNFMTIPLKIFTFFFFRDLTKKLLVFLLLILLFVLMFNLIFFRTSTTNFLSNQWNFLQKDVKSITFYKRSTYFNSTGKIVSNLKWEDFQAYKKTASLIQDFDEIAIQNPTCILGNAKLDAKAVFGSGCLRRNYIDINSLKNKQIQTYLKDLEFQKVFFDMAIYDKATELPVLLTDAVIGDNIAQVYFLPAGWQKYLQFPEVERLSEWKISSTDAIGKTALNLPYTIASATMKKVINPTTKQYYQLGDTIKFNVGLNGDRSASFLRAKIAAFVPQRYIATKTFFIDYNVLSRRDFSFPPLITNSDKTSPINAATPFNLLLSKAAITNPYRYLAIDLSFSKDVYDFQTKQLNIGGLLFANIESPLIYELIEVSKDYFGLFELYFSLIFVLMIIFAALSLVLGVIFLFQNETRIVNKFRLIGYRVQELFLSYLSVFFVLLFASLFIGFGLALLMFSYFDLYFQELGVFIYIYDVFQYLLWVLGFAFGLLVSYSFYQFRFFQKRIFLEPKRV